MQKFNPRARAPVRVEDPVSTLPSGYGLIDLVRELREFNPVNTEDAFEFLCSKVGPNIRIRYEVVKGGDAEPADGGNRRRRRFEHLNTLTVKRVLLSSDRNKADFNSLLVQQCNGVVLSYPDWKVLAVPAPMFNPKYKMSSIAEKIHEYTVYEISDGTTLNLYWYDNRWCMSTTNGFEINNYKWIGNLTYADGLTQSTRGYPDFGFDKLDKTRSYTVGFRHHDFHPLLADPARAWFIQSCDVDAANKGVISTTYDDKIGIPPQTLVALPKLDNKGVIAWMTTKNANSLARYFTTLKEMPSKCEIHYGFILRGSFDKHSVHTNVMIESELLSNVRRLIYNVPKNEITDTFGSEGSRERLEYMILRAFLSYNTRFNFLQLFPQFAKQFDTYNDYVSKLIDRVCDGLRNNHVRGEIARRSNVNNPNPNLSLRIDRLANYFIGVANNTFSSNDPNSKGLNPLDSNTKSIITDLINDTVYVDQYYMHLVAGQTTMKTLTNKRAVKPAGKPAK